MSVTGDITIRPLRHDEWDETMALVWRTFMRFDAKDYSEQGIESFKNFITDQTLQRMFDLGVYRVYGAFKEEKIVGMISLRNEIMISLLFVDEQCHFEGIGKSLIAYLKENVIKREGHNRVIVNAAPYALEFYHKLGFTDTAGITENDGISYTPMELMIS